MLRPARSGLATCQGGILALRCSGASPAGVIEATQPDRVRVTMPGGIQMELERPVVDDDQLVGRSIENERVGGAITQTFVATDSALEAARSLSSALGIDLSVPTSGEPVSGQTKSRF